MAYDEFKPILWSDKILNNLDKAHVFGALANRDYEGEVAYGTSVKISEVGNVTVSNYTGSTITYQTLDDASKILQINKKKIAPVKIDDVDAVQAKPKLMNKLTERVAYAIADDIDSSMAALYTDAGVVSGSTISPTSITSANVTAALTTMGKLLDEKNVPQQGRVAVVPAWFKEKIVLAKITKDTDNSNVLASGFVGNYAGFDIFMSNNVSHSSTTWYAPMFFVRDMTLAYAGQLEKVEALRDINTVSDLLRALQVYGTKVIYPDSLGVLYCAAGSET